MTESAFWMFLTLSQEGGRMPVVSGCVDIDDPQIRQANKYISGHEVLFEGHDTLSSETIADIGSLLFNKLVSLEAKEAALVILAHHPSKEALNIVQAYNKRPDPKLKYFAKIALDECELWNE